MSRPVTIGTPICNTARSSYGKVLLGWWGGAGAHAQETIPASPASEIEDEVNQLDEIIVVGRRGSIISSLDEKRNADTIQDHSQIEPTWTTPEKRTRRAHHIRSAAQSD